MSSDVLASMRGGGAPPADIDSIEDEDLLKQMWQAAEDFGDKRRIRARMYKLREKRLKDFYNNDDVMTVQTTSGSSSGPAETTMTLTTTTTMETDESSSFTNRPFSAEQKRRSSSRNSLPGDGEDEDPVVSEKIRRKSSVRTQRLQKVLNEIQQTGNDVVMTTTASSNGAPSWPAVQQLPMELETIQTDGGCYEELRSSSSVREWTEGDVLSIVEVRETWRRVREPGQPEPITQRVTLTKTVRKRLSDGAVLEENEDEVIDDMDEGGADGPTAVDAALRRSSIVAGPDVSAVPPVEERPFTAQKSFETGKEADSLDDSSSSSGESGAGDADSLDGQQPEKQPPVIKVAQQPVKRTTSSDSASAKSGGSAAAKAKRTDSGPIRKTMTTTTTTTSSSSSSSRTGLGGINRSAPNSRAVSSASTTEVKKTTSSSIPRLSGRSSPSPPAAQPQQPRKKISDASMGSAADESVAEFLRLEQEALNASAEANGTTGTIKRSPASRTTSSNSIRSTTTTNSSRTAATASSIPARKAVTTSPTSATTTTRKVETKTVSSSSSSKLASPRGTTALPSNLKPAMVRTVETTRTVTVRDQDDKPWRQNVSSKASGGSGSGSNTPSRIRAGQAGKAGAAALHSNVMTVLEKYVETDGCAIHGHGHHHHHHDDDHHQEPERPKSPAPAVKASREATPPPPPPPHQEVEPEEPATKERPKLFMPLASLGRSPSNLESPVLGSPSVVRKATRSLFQPDTSSSPEDTPPPVKRESSRIWSTPAAAKEPSPAKEVPAPPSPAVQQQPANSTGVIEDIQDLTLLENMLNTATNYDDRSRIRAHIRTVKKQLGLLGGVSSPMVTRKAVPAAAAPPAPSTAESTNKVESRSSSSSTTTTTSSSTVIRRSSQLFSSSTSSSNATTEAVTAPTEEEGGRKAPWRRQSSEANLEPAPVKATHLPEKEADTHPDTVDITSSYGTGPMDEFGRPLFGLGALRRKKPTSIPDADGDSGSPPQPIIIERSQPLTQLQKLHEQQAVKEPESPGTAVEKPRLKLRDSFTNQADSSEPEGGVTPPIISERSQALRDIIRIHQQAAATVEAKALNDPGPPSPAPKAKLKDSFLIPPDSPEEEEAPTDGTIEERSESFRTIVQRHQEQIVSSPPLKRPGILKKPKDWSSPSPQEFPSTPMKETASSSPAAGRKASIETSIEIQLNPSQASSIVVHEIPADRRGSSTFQYSSVQDVQVAGQSQSLPRKLSVDVEPSPAIHTTSLTLSTSSSSSSGSSRPVLTGDSSGHSVRSTSTFQLKTGNNNKTTTSSNTSSSSSRGDFQLTQGLAALRRKPQVTTEETVEVTLPPASSDPTPWRKKSLPSTAEEETTGKVTTTKTSSTYRSSYSSANKENPPPVLETTTTTTTTRTVNKLPVYQVDQKVTTTRSTGAVPSGVSSVRALAQKFLMTGEEKSQPQVSKSAAYPRAGLIFRSNSFRGGQGSPERRISTDSNGAPSGLSRTGSLRCSSPGRFVVERKESVGDVMESSSGSRRESTTMVTTSTSSRSFLTDRTPVRGMQDIIGRMSATPAGQDGTTEEDQRSLSLLNKLIGAQILVQSTEAALMGGGGHPEIKSVTTTKEEVSPDGSKLSRTVKTDRSGALTQSGVDEATGATWTSTRRSSSSVQQTTTTSTNNRMMADGQLPVIVDGVDINACVDDFKLNELLDNCNDYETRRKIRARIKALLADSKEGDGLSSSSSSASSSSSSSPSVIIPAAAAAAVPPPTGDVMAWVLNQSGSDVTTSSATPSAHPEGELFDSGTESGEDSVAQDQSPEDPEHPHESQSDDGLTSFMANLKMANGIMDDAEIPPARPPEELRDGPEFLRQVDSVLDRLKSSLRADETAQPVAPGDQQQALSDFIASGGLDRKQPWAIHPDQQSELIGLIDRLQSSLHNLQRRSADEPPPVPAPEPPAVVAPPTLVAPPAVEAPPAAEAPQSPAVKALSAVKMRAKNFSTPRPDNFLRNSWRLSGSEPASSPAGPAVPPPKVHLRTPEFLTNGGATSPGISGTAGVSHRPIWCRQDGPSAPASSSSPAGQPHPSRIVLEKSAIRGRFIHQPELQPAPKFTPKAAVPVKLPSFLLNRAVSAPNGATKSTTAPPLPVKAPSFDATKLARPSSPPKVIPAAVEASSPSSKLQIRSKAFSPVRAVSAPTEVPPSPPIPAEAIEEEDRGRKSRPRDVPWKVKLAKKRAERSTGPSIDGSVSVDLRKSIQSAAQRKSLEDVRQPDEALPAAPYPILKQKSLGELYAPKPKPFLSRSESLGAGPSVPAPLIRSWSGRTSSLDRTDSQTSEPTTPIITAAIAPSPSGHNWVLSTRSSSPAAGRAPLKRQEAMTSSSTEGSGPSGPEQVVTGILKLPAPSGAGAAVTASRDDPSQDLFTPSESIQIAVHKAAINKQIWAEEARRRGESLPEGPAPEPLVVSIPTAARPSPPRTTMMTGKQISLPEVKSPPPSSAVWNKGGSRAGRSNTVQLAGLAAQNSKWRPVQAPNSPPSITSGGFQPRPLGTNIRTAFEQTGRTKDVQSLPDRNRRSSSADRTDIHQAPDPSARITSANLQVQLNSGSYSMASSAPVKPAPVQQENRKPDSPVKPAEPIHAKLTVNSQQPVLPAQPTPSQVQQPVQQIIGMTVCPSGVKPVIPAFRRLQRQDRSASSIQSSLKSGEDDEDEADKLADADDEASPSQSSSSSSSSSVSDPTEERDEDPIPQPAKTGMKHLSRLLQKYSDGPPRPSYYGPAAGQHPHHHLMKSSSQDLPGKAGSVYSVSSVVSAPPRPTGQLAKSSSQDWLPSNNSSSSVSLLLPPAQPTAGTGQPSGSLRQSRSSSALFSPDHYVDPSGPTLVGLVAKNVQQMARPPPSSLPSIQIDPTSPVNQLMKSVSGSRIVSQTAQKMVQQATSALSIPAPVPISRPKSLVIPPAHLVPSSPPELTRRASPSAVIVGTKQYEASLSPDSAEKKQREVMQFFSAQHQQAVSPSRTVAQQPTATRPPPPLTRELSCQSDVDDVFDQLLAEALSPDASTHPGGQGASKASNPFVDRRRAWEASMGHKVHLNSGGSSSPARCPADGMTMRQTGGGTSVHSKSEVTTTRQSSTARQPLNAFSKFQQLDQSVKTTTTRVVQTTSSSSWGSAGARPTAGPSGGGSSHPPLVRSASGIKDFLMQWCQARTRNYQNVQIENFSTSWNDGLAFCALIHHFYPDSFDFNQLEPKNRRYNFTLAFKTAEERAGIAPLLDVDDMVMMSRPDWKCVFTYVQSFYRRFKDEC